jgi:hypothetical protein
MKIEDEKLEKYTLWFATIGVITFGLTLILFLACSHYDLKQDLDTTIFNDFGSFLSGSAGLLFTIATTILVYMTYRTQKEELKEAREEAEASRKALELQARTTQLQQFENTFFNLLGNHREVLKSLQETWVQNDNLKHHAIIEGKKLIDKTTEFIKTIIRGLNNSSYAIVRGEVDLEYQGFIPKGYRDSIGKEFKFEWKPKLSIKCKSHLANTENLHLLYEKVFLPNRSSLGHYFRNLFHLVKFVDEYTGFDSLDSNKEIFDIKYKYIRLVRAQLSNNELFLLALNSITDFGEEFVPFIEKYKLLKNISIFEELDEMDGLLEKYPHFA